MRGHSSCKQPTLYLNETCKDLTEFQQFIWFRYCQHQHKEVSTCSPLNPLLFHSHSLVLPPRVLFTCKKISEHLFVVRNVGIKMLSDWGKFNQFSLSLCWWERLHVTPFKSKFPQLLINLLVPLNELCVIMLLNVRNSGGWLLKP